MIIRHALNFTAHLVAGMAMGALAVTAVKALRQRDREEWTAAVGPDEGTEPIEPR